MLWGDFERTIVWSGVTFERTKGLSEVILSAQSSGQCSGFELGHGRTIVWTMVWLWSDQRSFPSGKVWSETVSSALRAHTVFRRTLVWSEDTLVWEGLIRGNFPLARSDQGSLPDGTSTWVRFLKMSYTFICDSPKHLLGFTRCHEKKNKWCCILMKSEMNNEKTLTCPVTRKNELLTSSNFQRIKNFGWYRLLRFEQCSLHSSSSLHNFGIPLR